VGHVFRKGDVPSGLRIAGSNAQLLAFEADIRNRWPDGSAKFAVLSGLASIGASASIDVALAASASPAPTAAPVSLSDLKAAGVSASIAFGANTATWSGADWDSPHAVIQSGTTMSSWVFRKPLGADAHLVGWLEIRCFSNKQVEVLPWVENCYLSIAGATTKSGRAVFTLNGSVRYDSVNDANYASGYGVSVVSGGSVNLGAQSRMVLVSAGVLSHWTGVPPQIIPKHSRSYLEASKIVPAYRPSSIVESTLAGLSKNYSPMRTTYVNEGMGATGYEEGIGLLPNQSAIYIVSGDPRAYKAVVASGLSLGSYSIHYRDQSTNRPLLFASHPNKSTNTGSDLIPSPSGSPAYRYATSHHPAVSYLPYLLTGWNWFVEEIQFQVTLHYLACNPSSRQGANYFIPAGQGHFGGNSQGGPRAIGWAWRTLAMCASITPDADTSMRGQWVAALGYNATSYRQIHETGTWSGGLSWAPNNLGISYEPGFPSTTNGRVIWAPWQDNFITASVGLCWDLEVVTDATARANLQWFRDFKYRCVVGLLGAQNVITNWNYRDAAAYNIYIGVPGGGGTTMAWYANWGDAYTDNFGFGQTGGATNSGQSGNLLRGNTNDGFTTSYWGNLQPAIAYAVDHGAPGAAEAYARMSSAPNFVSSLPQYDALPVWGIKPR
jgi:hypothetical protein